MAQYLDPATLALEEFKNESLAKTAGSNAPVQPGIAPVEPVSEAPQPVAQNTMFASQPTGMQAIQQNDADRQSAWENIKGNKDLPMLGLMFGLSMLANSENKGLGAALGQAGMDTLGAYQKQMLNRQQIASKKADQDYKNARMKLWQNQDAREQKKAEMEAQFDGVKADAWKRYYNGDRSMDVMAVLFPQQYGQYMMNSRLAADKAGMRGGSGNGSTRGSSAPAYVFGGQPAAASPSKEATPGDGTDSLGGSYGSYYDLSTMGRMKGLPSKGTYSFGEPKMVTLPDGRTMYGAVDKSGKIFQSWKMPEGGVPDNSSFLKPGEKAKSEVYDINAGFGAIGVIKKDIDNAKKLGVEPTGLILGNIPNDIANRLQSEGIDLRSSVANFASDITRIRSGQAVSKHEKEMLTKFLPSEKDSLEILLGKIQKYEDFLRSKGKAWVKTYGNTKSLDSVLSGDKLSGEKEKATTSYEGMSNEELLGGL